MADSITPQELKALLGGDETPGLFDVRRKSDFDAAPGKIPCATWHDPEQADAWIHDIPRDKPIIVYCVKGGSVSQSIASKLEQSNPDVRFLQGGIKAWLDLGEPVED